MANAVASDLVQRGLACHRAGQLESAKDLYNQALVNSPHDPDALHLSGLVELQGGNVSLAVERLRKASQGQPRNWMFRGNLANALATAGRVEEAMAAFQRAAKLKPDEPQFLLGAANCLAMLKRFAEAEAQLRALTRRFPGLALAWFNLANAVRDQNRAREAVETYRHAIQVDPGLVEAYINLGSTLLALAKFADAEASFRQALLLSPADPRVLCNLASVLIDRGKFAEAEAECRKALSVAPDLVIAHSFLGAAIGHQGRLLEALELHRKAAQLAPGDVRALLSLGTALYEIGTPAEGIPYLQRALELAPDLWQAKVAIGTAQLALGNFHDGWAGYFQRADRQKFARQYPGLPIASALPSAAGGTAICLLNEQGLGDQLFLLRWAPWLKSCGAVLSYRPDPKLESIFRRVPLVDVFVPSAVELPKADCYLMLGDLPYLLTHSRDKDVIESGAAAATPRSLQLEPLAENLAALRDQLRKLGPPPYIGITWRGGTPPEEQRGAGSWMLFKEVPMEQLATAIGPVEGTMLALQRNPGNGEIARLSRLMGRTLHDVSSLNDDLEQMLALIALIDDYVGVSNTNMHLRAAVGGTARVLVPCPPEWRWMASGGESPWFPGFGVYRQNIDGGWSEALARLSNDLQAAFPPGVSPDTSGHATPLERP